MNLTTEELIKLVEENDLKAFEFENKLRDEYGFDSDELNSYNQSSIITLLGLMKFNNLTVDEMLEKCLDDLHKSGNI